MGEYLKGPGAAPSNATGASSELNERSSLCWPVVSAQASKVRWLRVQGILHCPFCLTQWNSAIDHVMSSSLNAGICVSAPVNRAVPLLQECSAGRCQVFYRGCTRIREAATDVGTQAFATPASGEVGMQRICLFGNWYLAMLVWGEVDSIIRSGPFGVAA